MRTGSGTKGTRHYDWAMLEVTGDDTPGGHVGGHSVLLARRHRYTGTLSFYRCWTPGPRSPAVIGWSQLNAVRGDLVVDGAGVAGDGGRVCVDLVEEQFQGAGDAP